MKRYLGYLLLLYIFIPFNQKIDIISILIFFVILNESPVFSVVFSFFAGLLLDLYYPVALGMNAMFHTILAQGLSYVKKYLIQEPLPILIIFTIFYILKVLLTFIFVISEIHLAKILLTIFTFLPIFIILNKIFYRVWSRS
uniref:Rod shape-determining protein MreD n=1 Tax=candidate division WOR-3 bacterium TaxID=2052148 RepID=A0A7C4TJI3_UNCW3